MFVHAAAHRGPAYKLQQDAAAFARFGGGAVIAVADGVGSSPRSEVASTTATASFVASVVSAGRAGRRMNRSVLRAAYAGASADIARAAAAQAPDVAPPLTTFVGAVATASRFIATWVGDGAVILFRGGGGRPYQLLLPHTGRGGFLTRVLTGAGAPLPAYLEIGRNRGGEELLLVGTDGVFPPGQALAVAQHLVQRLEEAARAAPREELDGRLRLGVADFLAGLPFDDNRAVALVVDGSVVDRWRRADGRRPAVAPTVDPG